MWDLLHEKKDYVLLDLPTAMRALKYIAIGLLVLIGALILLLFFALALVGL
jgi:hypothetical protein